MIGSYESKRGSNMRNTSKYIQFARLYSSHFAVLLHTCVPLGYLDGLLTVGSWLQLYVPAFVLYLSPFYIKRRGPNHSIFIGWLFQAKSMLFLKNCNKCNVQDSCCVWIISCPWDICNCLRVLLCQSNRGRYWWWKK